MTRALRWGGGLLAVLMLLAAIGWAMLDNDQRRALAHLPTNRDVLFWQSDQRDAMFRAMDRFPWLIGSRMIAAADEAYPLPAGRPLGAQCRCRCLHAVAKCLRAGGGAGRQGPA